MGDLRCERVGWWGCTGGEEGSGMQQAKQRLSREAEQRGRAKENDLQRAVRYGDIHTMLQLVRAGASVDGIGFDQSSFEDSFVLPLHIAAVYGRVEMVKALVMVGANTEVIGVSGGRPLHSAAGAAAL
jgi:ankyrin repeat protein